MKHPLTKAAILLAATNVAMPGIAAANEDPPIYWESENWRVVTKNAQSESYGWCELFSMHLAPSSLKWFRGGAETGYLQLHTRDPEAVKRGKANIRWEFDGQEYRGSVFGQGIYSSPTDNPQLISSFKKARNLTITHGDKTVAEISLTGSFRAHQKLSECARQWPTSRVPVVPPPSPMRVLSTRAVDRDSDQGAEANEVRPKPIPLRQRAWLSYFDYPPIAIKERMTGRVGFRLRVSKLGRVSECNITVSSGHALLDETTCKGLQRRARFLPATDEKGLPVEGTYTSSVRWAIPG